MNVVGVVLGIVVLVVFLLVMGGAVVLGMERSSRRYAAKRKEQEEAVEVFIRKEEGLAERDAVAVMRDAPRGEEHGKRTEELAERARTRVRDRARSMLSGGPGTGGAGGD